MIALIGGIFIKARDSGRLREWYRKHLGLPIADWGGVSFDGREARPGERQTSTVWSVFSGDTSYFEPSTSPFMINYRVDDLDAVLSALRAEGCEVDERIDESEFGRFGWVMDPEGNKLELWSRLWSELMQITEGAEGNEGRFNFVLDLA